jgi:hypothetical protein
MMVSAVMIPKISVSSRREERQILLTIQGNEVALSVYGVNKLVRELRDASLEVVSRERKTVSFEELLRDRMADRQIGTEEWQRQIAKQVEINHKHIEAERKRIEAEIAERKARDKVVSQLIDAGYKLLAKKLHPDKGGSSEAMTRLNQAREQLRGDRRILP